MKTVSPLLSFMEGADLNTPPKGDAFPFLQRVFSRGLCHKLQGWHSPLVDFPREIPAPLLANLELLLYVGASSVFLCVMVWERIHMTELIAMRPMSFLPHLIPPSLLFQTGALGRTPLCWDSNSAQKGKLRCCCGHRSKGVQGCFPDLASLGVRCWKRRLVWLHSLSSPCKVLSRRDPESFF